MMQLSSEDRQRAAHLKFKLFFLDWRRKMLKSKQRWFGLNELVQTEATYCKDLIIIRDKIQQPLIDMKIITQQEQQELFPNIQGMINLSEQLLMDITILKDSWNPLTTVVGPTMLRYSKFLQIYAEFFRTYERTRKWLFNLLQRKEGRDIQAELSPTNFDDLWSKPFQRTLKYPLFLKTYLKQCHPWHPDYPQIARALKSYEEAGERNNKTLQLKEKNQILLALDARYPGILNQDSKMYIGEVSATFIDQKVKCHMLTNMLLVVTDDPLQTQLMRLYLDQNSFVASLKDLLYFKNRLYICGKKHSVHLCFPNNKLRTECQRQVQGIINEIYKSQYMRKELTSNLHNNRASQQNMRQSYMQLPQILPKPPRMIVLGQIRRRYGCVKSFKIYFLIKFTLPYGQENSQELYIDMEQLLALQTSMRTLYPQQLKQLPLLQQASKNMTATDIRVNSTRAIQYKSIYATIMLNFLFRHPQITKRTDIIAHRLHVGQPMWLYLRYGTLGCRCRFCKNGAVLSNIDNYQRQAAQRANRRKEANTFFCPFRTFHAQNMLAQADLSLLPTAKDRLLFLRCEKGLLDYRLADSTPGSPLRKKVLVHIQRIEGSRTLQLFVNPQQRVGQVVQLCGKVLGLRMEDHELLLIVNKNTYLLGRDEILWGILQNQTTAGDNFFSFFKSAFGEKEDLSFKLYLRKVWVLESALQKANYQHEGQVAFLIEQFVLRLRRQQVKLNMDNTSTLYACYFALQKINKESPTNEEDLKALIAPKRWKAMQVQQRTQLLGIVRLKVDAVMGKLTPAQIYRKLWNYAVSMGQNCPGWSAFFFNAAVQAHPQYEQGFQVRVGADLQKLYIMQADRMTTILQFPLMQVQTMLVFSSWEMHICTSQFEYIFSGDSLLHLEQLINTYLLYKQLTL